MRISSRSWLAVLLLSAFSLPAAAESGAIEICRFPSGGEEPFQRWFASQEIVCADAATAQAFGKGEWNVFARSHDGVSSAILVDGSSAPPALSLPLVPSATVRVEVPAGLTGVVYVPRRVTAYPSGVLTQVPAGEELWVFVVSKTTPIAVVVVPPIDAGSERTIEARNASSIGRVVGWLQLPEADRAALKTAKGVSSPRLRITTAGKELVAGTMPPAALLDGALVLLGGPAVGKGELEISGRGWLPWRQKVDIDSHAMTLLKGPIIVRASSTLIVNWNTNGDLAALDASLGSCEETGEPPRFELTISTCAEPMRGDAVDLKSCQPIRQQPLPTDRTFGSVTIDEVTPGFYRAEMRFGKLPPISTTASIPPLQVRPVPLIADYFAGYGSLTRGGHRLGEPARITFPAGVGFLARDSDEYHAVFSAPFGVDALINIVTCRGERMMVLTDRSLTRRARFDIDVPDNKLSLAVVDTFTRMPLDAARLQYVLMSLRVPRRPVFMQVLTAKKAEMDAYGSFAPQFVIDGVPERELRLQVSSPGYEKKNVEPFSLTKSEKKTIEVQLLPLNGTRGRIVSSRPFEQTILFWYSPGGVESEHSEVDSDGSFYYDARQHVLNETIAVVSISHPLWIARAPLFDRRAPLEIVFPDAAPVRDVDVRIRGNPLRTATPIGLVIGGLRVPARALAIHLTMHKSDPILRDAGPLRIPSIAETGPIDILRGTTIAWMPTFAGFPAPSDFVPTATKRLEGREVVFEVK